MICATFLAIAVQQQLWSSSRLLLNPTVNTADLIVVARVTGPAEWSQRSWVDESGTPAAEPNIWVAKVPMRTILSLKGNAPMTFTYVEAAGKPHTLDISGTKLAPATTNSIVLVWLYRQNSGGYFRTLFSSNSFRATGDDELHYAHLEPVPVLPDSAYVVEGSTPVERYCSILAQAYAVEPGAARSKELLRWMDAIRPMWKFEHGQTLLYVPDSDVANWDGPGFFAFARTRLIPRLLATGGSDLLRRLRANYYAYQLAGDDVFAVQYRQLVDELDSTWSDPEAEDLIEGLIGDRAYMASQLNARLACVRVQALARLDLRHESIPTVVQKLRSDTSFHVKYAATKWLQRFRESTHGQYSDAPQVRVNFANQTIENLQEVIDYWSSH